MSKSTKQPALRFGEFLCENQIINEEQLLDALADHWSNGGRLGMAISRRGILTCEQVERWAAVYHDVVSTADSAQHENAHKTSN